MKPFLPCRLCRPAVSTPAICLSLIHIYEVVQTSHGYTLMAWEPHRNDWYSAEIQKTPEDLRNALLDTYANFLEDKITGNDRDLTVTETGEIQQRCRELWEKCRET